MSVDGTRIKANASKNSAVSYKRAGKMIEQLEFEIEELTRKAVLELEADGQGPTVYCAVEKQYHHRSVEDLLEKEDPPAPAVDASVKEIMAHRLKSKEGKNI